MKVRIISAVVLFVLCGTLCAATYDLSADFSDADNPNGVWTYGWFPNWIPGSSDLTMLDDNGVDVWSETNGVSIWKNNTGSAVNGVPAGQVGLNSTPDEPAVVRWTAPSAIGLAVVRIEGSFTTNSVPGMQIVMNEAVLLIETNAATFDLEVMVDTGDILDFYVCEPTEHVSTVTPFELTVTTLKEHLALTTLDDFDGSGAVDKDWETLPTVSGGGFDAASWGSTNFAACANDEYNWGKGEYRDFPFLVSTNTGHVTFRHFAMVGSSYPGSYGIAGIDIIQTNSESASGFSTVLGYGIKAYTVEQAAPRIYCYTPATGRMFAEDLPEAAWIEFRTDIDFSYVDGEGTFGIFNLFYRQAGTSLWKPVSGFTQVELHIEDPSAVFKIAGIVSFYENAGGFRPYLDDIRFCDGTNPMKGAGANLLLNADFSRNYLAWRTDGYGHSVVTAYVNNEEANDGVYICARDDYYDNGVQVCQEVNLLGQGFSTNDIDAGLCRVAFGGRLYSGTSRDGQIHIDFLNINNFWISSASLPGYTGDWMEQMATNTIPAGTRSIRYTFDTGGADYWDSPRLDNAYLAVLGVPQEDVTLTVSSILGSPSPAVGTATNSWNTTVTCSVSDVVNGQTQYECIGWGGTGSVPTSGVNSSVQVTLTEDSSITWLWQTNYWLDVTVSGSGSASHSSGWYAKDAVIELIQYPVPGWLFMGWSGDASGTNQVILTMDEPKSITAIFSDDADGDGLTNNEEDALGSNPWKTDTDDDGFDDKLEADHSWNPAVSDQWVVDHIRSNSETFDLYSSNVVLDVAIGQALFAVADSNAILQLQLEQSDDLVTWTNAGDAVEWNLNVDGEKMFLRVRSAPGE